MFRYTIVFVGGYKAVFDSPFPIGVGERLLVPAETSRQDDALYAHAGHYVVRTIRHDLAEVGRRVQEGFMFEEHARPLLFVEKVE